MSSQNLHPQRRPKFWRRRWIVDRKFQLSFLGVALAIAALTAALFYVPSLWLLQGFENSEFFLALSIEHPLRAVTSDLRYSFALTYLLAFFISFLIVATFGLIISNRVAGPIFRLRKHLLDLEDENFVPDLRFRSGDYFHDLAREFTQFLQQRAKQKRSGIPSDDSSGGFSIVEVLIAGVVVGIFALAFSSSLNRAKVTAVKTDQRVASADFAERVRDVLGDPASCQESLLRSGLMSVPVEEFVGRNLQLYTRAPTVPSGSGTLLHQAPFALGRLQIDAIRFGPQQVARFRQGATVDLQVQGKRRSTGSGGSDEVFAKSMAIYVRTDPSGRPVTCGVAPKPRLDCAIGVTGYALVADNGSPGPNTDEWANSTDVRLMPPQLITTTDPHASFDEIFFVPTPSARPGWAANCASNDNDRDLPKVWVGGTAFCPKNPLTGAESDPIQIFCRSENGYTPMGCARGDMASVATVRQADIGASMKSAVPAPHNLNTFGRQHTGRAPEFFDSATAIVSDGNTANPRGGCSTGRTTYPSPGAPQSLSPWTGGVVYLSCCRTDISI